MNNTTLKALRQSVGVSTAVAARQVHIAQRSWLRYESGERPIPEGVIELFCLKNGVHYPVGG